VLRDLEEIYDAREPGLASECWRDVGDRCLEEFRHDDLAGRQRITTSDFHMWSLPQPDRRRDVTTTNWVAKFAHELHALPVVNETGHANAHPLFESVQYSSNLVIRDCTACVFC
jgi:hypothetical protein